MAVKSDWINIKITSTSAKIRQMVTNRIFEFCMSDGFLDEDYVRKLKGETELNFSSSLDPDGRFIE